VTGFLLLLIVAATAASDLLQAWEGRRQGGVHTADGLGRHMTRWPIALSIVCMAVSFFAFIAALRIADMSYVVPASAASIALETLLAAWLLHERVSGRRWTGVVLVAAGVALLAQS
jgi:uncharacterized membrane protein